METPTIVHKQMKKAVDLVAEFLIYIHRTATVSVRNMALAADFNEIRPYRLVHHRRHNNEEQTENGQPENTLTCHTML